MRKQLISAYVKENIEHQVPTAIFLQEEKQLSPAQLKHIRALQGEFDRLLADVIQAEVDAEEFHILDVKLASLSIAGMVRWVHRWYRPNGRMKPADIAEGMSELGLNLVGYTQARDNDPTSPRRSAKSRAKR